MVLQLPAKLIPRQSDVRETATSDLIGQAVPVGAILAWAKNLTGVPALPAGFAECDGSVISDGDSPMDGQTLPDLNGSEFLRGNTTSGGTGGGTTGAGSAHTHTTSGTSAAGSAHTHTQDGSVSSHTLTTGEIPSHAHTIPCYGHDLNNGDSPEGTSDGTYFGAARSTGTAGTGGGHTHNDTFSNANESAHTHGIGTYAAANESAHTHTSQPKYYDVVWIMRIK